MEVGGDRRGGSRGGVRRRRGGRGPSGSSRSGVSAPDPDRARAGERGGGAWGEGVGRLGFGRGGVGGGMWPGRLGRWAGPRGGGSWARPGARWGGGTGWARGFSPPSLFFLLSFLLLIFFSVFRLFKMPKHFTKISAPHHNYVSYFRQPPRIFSFGFETFYLCSCFDFCFRTGSDLTRVYPQ